MGTPFTQAPRSLDAPEQLGRQYAPAERTAQASPRPQSLADEQERKHWLAGLVTKPVYTHERPEAQDTLDALGEHAWPSLACGGPPPLLVPQPTPSDRARANVASTASRIKAMVSEAEGLLTASCPTR